MKRVWKHLAGWGFLFLALAFLSVSGRGAEFLNWRAEVNRVDADVQKWDVLQLLERIATATGWEVYLEPETTHHVSAKFKDLPPAEALRLLLGKLNFALLPQTNAPSRFLVFRTTAEGATQLIRPGDQAGREGANEATLLPNELIITVKPGSDIDIDELARQLGAKIVGRMDELGAYRLQFESEEAADAARELLGRNSDIASVDSNYRFSRLPLPEALAIGGARPLNLAAGSAPSGDKPTIALIDAFTSDMPDWGDLNQLLLPTLSVTEGADFGEDLGHGPAMVYMVLEALSKIDPNAGVRILPINAFTGQAITTFEVGQAGWMANQQGAAILNFSLGSDGDSPFLGNIIRTIQESGTLIFAAPGNTPVTEPMYPAAYPGVIAVTAGDAQGNIADYANRGSFVDLIVPGTGLVPFNGQVYMINGTSVSSARAAGITAGLVGTGLSPTQAADVVRQNWGVKK